MRILMKGLVILAACFLLVGAAVDSRAQATADQYYQAGLQLYQANDHAQALRYFGAALQVDPNHAGAARGIGNCYIATNQPAQALAYYEKAIALDPNDTQLAQFVTELRTQVGAAASATAAPGAVAPATASAYAQGKALFDQKQYPQAQPFFMQALAENPMDANSHFYLGYCQYVSGDRKGAALSFARANQISPNATAQSYGDRIKAGLTPEEQVWVDAELAKGLPTKAAAPAAAAKKTKFAIRIVPGIAMFTLGDLKTDSDAKMTLTADLQETVDPSIGLDGTIPSGSLCVAVEPVVPMGNSLELGLHFETMMVGTYDYTITNSQEGAMEYTQAMSSKISAMPLGLVGRFFLAPPEKKLRPFLGFSALYAMTGIDYTFTSTYGTAYDLTQTGNLKANAMGGGLQLGADFALAGSIKVSPFVGYRMLKAKGFTGAITDSGADMTYDAELRITNGTGGMPAGHLFAVPTSNPTDAGYPDDIMEMTNAAEVDFGGLMGGLALSFFF